MGLSPFHHPIAGDLTLNYDVLEIPADPGQAVVAHSAPTGSAARKAFDQLPSWTTAPATLREDRVGGRSGAEPS